MYCLDTDVLSAVLTRDPPLHLIRRWPERPQSSSALAGRILPFDERAAERYGAVRANLERERRRLAEPDLRIAAIALSRDMTRDRQHAPFARVPDLRIENWLVDE